METDSPSPPLAERALAWWRSTGEHAHEVDTVSATKLTAVIALLIAAMQAVFLVINPPTHGLGSAGWVLGAGLVTALAIGGWTLFDRRTPLQVDAIFLVAAAGMVQAAVICALTAGEPERQLIALWLALSTAISPRTRALMALSFAYLVGALPLIGTHIDTREGAQLLGDAMLWAVFAGLVHLLLAGVRRQRQAFQTERITLEDLARRDELTGLGNRRALQEALEELDRAVQADELRAGTLAIFDIESFKEINDIDGLSAGDRCLRQLAESVRRTAPAGSGTFRWGGDEFVVVLPDHDLASARRVILTLQAAVADGCHTTTRRRLGTRWGLGELRQGVALGDALAAAEMELLEQKGSEPEEVAEPRMLDGPRRFARTR